MADFTDFQQVDEGGDLGNFAADGSDPFASAMGGMEMNSQPNMDGDLGAFAAPPIQAQHDYTPEELALIQKVE